MPLLKFDIRNTKAIQFAACDKVPPVMVIAGPNGIGKSTLAVARVDKILSNQNELNLFSGKAIVRAFYQRHIGNENISYGKFCYDLAQIIADKELLNATLNLVFDQLN